MMAVERVGVAVIDRFHHPYLDSLVLPQTRIYVDMDGVIVEPYPAVIRELRANGWPDFTIEDWTSWDIVDVLGGRSLDVAMAILATERIYEDATLVPGSIEAFAAFRANPRILPVVLTAPLWANATAKVEWLLRHDFLLKEIVLAADKNLVACDAGDYLIDDNPAHFKSWPGMGLLYDRPWNQNYECDGVRTLRVFNWEEVCDAFL